MATATTRIAQTSSARNEVSSETSQPKSAEIAAEGINDASQFARLMSAVISDVATGDITPGIANAMVNAGGKLLKVVEMRLRFGNRNGGSVARNLQLVEDVE